MSAKGFGQSPQNPKIDKLVKLAVRHCRQRSPEGLDSIFDNLPVNLNKQVVAATLAALQQDIDTLSWYCGYFAGEINRAEDNQKPNSITKLSKILITTGMEPFADFVPYPGCRIVILNSEKFESLPEEVKAIVQQAFVVMENSSEEVQRVNDALLQELVVE
ncbi:hypothetical protein I8748_19925 [Nostoc sp. CENA67]|uniref:Uncharacterized protein n=2 Tax=Amazonocrinis TaxID=2840440 RepID=A0A8J7HW84_9NOST|nr:hypothetical protein [Amazonocrinis nigriterrae CENA67]